MLILFNYKRLKMPKYLTFKGQIVWARDEKVGLR